MKDKPIPDRQGTLYYARAEQNIYGYGVGVWIWSENGQNRAQDINTRDVAKLTMAAISLHEVPEGGFGYFFAPAE